MTKARSYHTALFGKWHLGDFVGEPLQHGFDRFYGFLGGAIENLEHDQLDWAFSYTRSYENRKIAKHDLWENSTPVTNDGVHMGDLVVRETNAFMETHRNGPFFIYAAFNFPHYPVQPYQSYYDRYSGMAEPRRSYAALVSTLDDQIGRILSKLDELGLAEDTLVIYFGDHGYSVEVQTKMWNPAGSSVAPGGGRCSPFRGTKFQLYEGGIRVPAIVRWPRMLPAGESRGQLLSSMDLVPTVAKLLGVDLPNRVDGGDMMPVLIAEQAAGPHRVLNYRMNDRWALREGDWKVVKETDTPSPVLYNLAGDPGESVDLTAANPGISDRFQRMNALWQAAPGTDYLGIGRDELAVSDAPWESGTGIRERDYMAGSSILMADGSFVPKGLYSERNASLSLRLGGARSMFRARPSLTTANSPAASARFEVLGDGIKLFESGPLSSASAVPDVEVDVGGVDLLELRTTGTTGGSRQVWGAARVTATGESLAFGLMGGGATPVIRALPHAGGRVWLELDVKEEVVGAEYYVSLSNDLHTWRDALLRHGSPGGWTVSGSELTVASAEDLGDGRWKVSLEMAATTPDSFARLLLRAVPGY